MYSRLWTCLQLDGNSLLLQVRIVKYSLFRRIAPLSDSDLGNILRRREEAKNRWEEKSEWWEEDEPTSEDHHVCPPCRLPLHFLVCLSLSLFLALFTFLLISLVFFSFSVVISHPSLSPSLYVSCSPLSVTHLFSLLCFYSCLFAALHFFARSLFLSSSLLNSILINDTVHIHTFVCIKLKS